MCACVFFFNDTATTEIYTLSLHDALPISSISTRDQMVRATMVARALPIWLAQRHGPGPREWPLLAVGGGACGMTGAVGLDRKSTRLNSSHLVISYAAFCLTKKTDCRCSSP